MPLIQRPNMNMRVDDRHALTPLGAGCWVLGPSSKSYLGTPLSQNGEPEPSTQHPGISPGCLYSRVRFSPKMSASARRRAWALDRLAAQRALCGYSGRFEPQTMRSAGRLTASATAVRLASGG